MDWCPFDSSSDNFAHLEAFEQRFLDPTTKHFCLRLCWPGTARESVAWSQRTDPTTASPRVPDYAVKA